jgi:rSAM/selenodomain-associated transferase 1
MAKAPIPGAVKTRLVPPLTEAQAAELYRALMLDQLEHLGGLDNVELYLAYAPDEAAPLMKSLAPAAFHCFAQRGEDLGARMSLVFDELWIWGHRNVILIGSDLPPVPFDVFDQAFARLAAGKRVVLGPSQDGGYYLVGLNRPTPEIFTAMTWSHDRVLVETAAKLVALGIEFSLLSPWFDIDTAADIDRLRHVTDDPAIAGAMKRTSRFLHLAKF